MVTSGPAERAMMPGTHLMVGGGVGIDRDPTLSPAGAMPGVRTLLERVNPATIVQLELETLCTCGHEGCSGITKPRQMVGMITSWDMAAALAAQLQVYVETLPVDLRDQALALQAEHRAQLRQGIGLE